MHSTNIRNHEVLNAARRSQRVSAFQNLCQLLRKIPGPELALPVLSYLLRACTYIQYKVAGKVRIALLPNDYRFSTKRSFHRSIVSGKTVRIADTMDDPHTIANPPPVGKGQAERACRSHLTAGYPPSAFTRLVQTLHFTVSTLYPHEGNITISQAGSCRSGAVLLWYGHANTIPVHTS